MTRERFRPEDHPHDHFLLTTSVGSYPTPDWLDRCRGLRENEEADFGREDWREATGDACRVILEEHERAGLDAVVDGEMRRNEMVEYFARRIDGYEFRGPVKVWGHNTFDKPSVVDEVERDEPWVVDEYRFAADVAERPVKVPITGPYTLGTFCFDEVYGDDRLIYDLAELVREEVQDLVDAGARYVQIDEPALAMTPEDHAVVDDCLERIVAGLPDDVRVGLHVCYGDYSRIYPEVLEFPIDELDLELANNDYEQLEVFAEPEFTMDFAPGVVNVHDAEVESVAEIKANIRTALEIVPPERLVVSHDCGPKLLPRDAAFEKTRNMVRAAREVEAELDAGEI